MGDIIKKEKTKQNKTTTISYGAAFKETACSSVWYSLTDCLTAWLAGRVLKKGVFYCFNFFTTLYKLW